MSEIYGSYRTRHGKKTVTVSVMPRGFLTVPITDMYQKSQVNYSTLPFVLTYQHSPWFRSALLSSRCIKHSNLIVSISIKARCVSYEWSLTLFHSFQTCLFSYCYFIYLNCAFLTCKRPTGIYQQRTKTLYLKQVRVCIQFYLRIFVIAFYHILICLYITCNVPLFYLVVNSELNTFGEFDKKRACIRSVCERFCLFLCSCGIMVKQWS